MGSLKQALLSSLNVFYFWWAAVLAGGLARLAGRSWAAAGLWVFGLYFLVIAAAIGFRRPFVTSWGLDRPAFSCNISPSRVSSGILHGQRKKG